MKCLWKKALCAFITIAFLALCACGGSGSSSGSTDNAEDQTQDDGNGGDDFVIPEGGDGTGYDTGRCCNYELDGTDSATCGNLAVSNYLDGISWGKLIYENSCPFTFLGDALVVVQYSPCKGTIYTISCGGAENCTDGWHDINGAMDSEGRFHFDFEWDDYCYCCTAKQITETNYYMSCSASTDGGGTYVPGSLCGVSAN